MRYATFPIATRLTIVTKDGIQYEDYDAFPDGMEIHVQDQGRTVKVFDWSGSLGGEPAAYNDYVAALESETRWRERALAAEAKLAALLSDEAVERACVGFYNDPHGLTNWNSLARVDPALADKYRAGQRAAIRAALGEDS